MSGEEGRRPLRCAHDRGVHHVANTVRRSGAMHPGALYRSPRTVDELPLIQHVRQRRATHRPVRALSFALRLSAICDRFGHAPLDDAHSAFRRTRMYGPVHLPLALSECGPKAHTPRALHRLASCSPETQSRQGTVPEGTGHIVSLHEVRVKTSCEQIINKLFTTVGASKQDGRPFSSARHRADRVQSKKLGLHKPSSLLYPRVMRLSSREARDKVHEATVRYPTRGFGATPITGFLQRNGEDHITRP